MNISEGKVHDFICIAVISIIVSLNSCFAPNIDLDAQRIKTITVLDMPLVVNSAIPLLLKAEYDNGRFEELTYNAVFTVTDSTAARVEGNVVTALEAGEITLRISVGAMDIEKTFTAVKESEPLPEGIPIGVLQGGAHKSPYEGKNVTGVKGIVTGIYTGKSYSSFYIQSETADEFEASSEAVKIGHPNSLGLSFKVGDLVKVSGTVKEYFSQKYDDMPLTTTQIQISSADDFSVLSKSHSVEPQIIGKGGRIPPSKITCNDGFGSISVPGYRFDPWEDGIDFWESLEGMKVKVNNPTTTSYTRYNKVYAVADGGADASTQTPRGGLIITEGDLNPEKIIIANAVNIELGDQFNGAVIGNIDYDMYDYYYIIYPSEALPSVTSRKNIRETSTLTKSSNRLLVASFNVENFSTKDLMAKPEDLAETIVSGLNIPDIIGLAEMQDDDGSANTEVTSAHLSAAHLIKHIVAAGGPDTYKYVDVAPADDQDGGIPGGNIRVGFLYNSARVSFNKKAAATSETAASVINNGGLELNFNPVRIDPANTAFKDSRKSLIGEFVFNGEKVFVAVNHFSSKRGDYHQMGDIQPPRLESESRRLPQSQAVNAFIDSMLAIDANANIIVLGDFNDFTWSDPMKALTGEDDRTYILSSLSDKLLLTNERYSYVYSGNSQELDHIFVSDALMKDADPKMESIHRYCEFSDQQTDHDPAIASFRLGTFTKDTSAPSFINTYPVISPDEQKIDVKVKLNELGKLYIDVQNAGTEKPETADIKSSAETVISVSHFGEFNAQISSLNAATSYDLWFVTEDDSFNLSDPLKRNVSTLALDTAAPLWATGMPSVNKKGSSDVEISVQVDENAKIYAVIIEADAASPTIEQVKAGTDSSDSAAKNSKLSVEAAKTAVLGFSGLEPSTSYKVYITAEDVKVRKNTTALKTLSVTTNAASKEVDLSGWKIEFWQNEAGSSPQLKHTLKLSGKYTKGKYLIVVRKTSDLKSFKALFSQQAVQTENIVLYSSTNDTWQANGKDEDSVKIYNPDGTLIERAVMGLNTIKRRKTNGNWEKLTSTSLAANAPDTITGLTSALYVYEMGEASSDLPFTDYRGNYALLYIRK